MKPKPRSATTFLMVPVVMGPPTLEQELAKRTVRSKGDHHAKHRRKRRRRPNHSTDVRRWRSPNGGFAADGVCHRYSRAPTNFDPRKERRMQLARVQFFSVSLDGFGTGEGLSRDKPFGHAGERLHEWMFMTRWWRDMVGEAGGSDGIDNAFLRLHDPGIGAEIMGAGKFGPPGWHEDPEWKGWWGPNPPFHTPVFVLTHHTRPSIAMDGGTTFHFVDSPPEKALEAAREAANGRDVRIGGGARTIREF